jgi:hypothetical protein
MAGDVTIPKVTMMAPAIATFNDRVGPGEMPFFIAILWLSVDRLVCTP